MDDLGSWAVISSSINGAILDWIFCDAPRRLLQKYVRENKLGKGSGIVACHKAGSAGYCDRVSGHQHGLQADRRQILERIFRLAIA